MVRSELVVRVAYVSQNTLHVWFIRAERHGAHDIRIFAMINVFRKPIFQP